MNFPLQIDPAIIASLGQTLLHFLWQGALLALCYLAAERMLRTSSARIRYAASSLTMLLMALSPVVTFALLWPSPGQTPATLDRFSGLARITAPANLPIATESPWTVWIVALWLGGIAALTVRNSVAYAMAWARVHTSQPSVPERWSRIVAQLSREFGIKHRVKAFASRSNVPSVFGHFRPVILLPVAALHRLTPDELEAIIAHELAHIARADWFVNLLQTVVETVLFYHPAVWWVSNQVRKQREFCCDDMATLTCKGSHLARALLLLEESRWTPALAASAPPLRARIERLLGVTPRTDARPNPSLLLFATLFVAAFLWQPAIGSQEPPPPPAAPPPPADGSAPVKAPPPPPAKGNTAKPAKAPAPPPPPPPSDVPPTPEPPAIPRSPAQRVIDEEISRRIRYADERFSSDGVPGSRTDRGRIYLFFGPPDELEVHPGTKEAWLYRDLANFQKNAIFEFDAKGKITKTPPRR